VRTFCLNIAIFDPKGKKMAFRAEGNGEAMSIFTQSKNL
jgi:hypothetical protein